MASVHFWLIGVCDGFHVFMPAGEKLTTRSVAMWELCTVGSNNPRRIAYPVVNSHRE